MRAAPAPEEQFKASTGAGGQGDDAVQREYTRVYSDMAAIHGMCEDYRAGAWIDLMHDAADLHENSLPMLALWGAKAPMGRLYNVLAIWRERATTVTGKAMPAGHNIQEDAPAETLAEIRAFLA